MKKIFIFTLALACSFSAFAQDDEEVQKPVKVAKPAKTYPTYEITGKVVDAVTGEPLAGAKVQAYNNPYYTAMAGEDGQFTIKVPDFVTSLSSNLDGYSLNRTAINGRKEITISLYTDKYLSSYTAKTSASKASTTTGFSMSNAVTAEQEIQNRLGAEVRSIQRSAIPGMGDAMFINGINSLNLNSQPLIVIDGVVYDMMYSETMSHNGYFNNLLTAVNLEDVESVSVLKNGTAIYGAKAANGVILINTKRAEKVETKIDVTMSFGVEATPEKPDMMGAEDYRNFASELIQGTGSNLNEYKFLNPDPSYYYYNMYHNNTDWSKEVYQEAFTQKYGISVTGGDDVANYQLSVGYLNSNSTLKKNDLERFNIRFNTDIVLGAKFTTRFDAYYTNTVRNLRNDGLASDYKATPISSPSVLGLIKSPFITPYDFSTAGIQSEFVADADDYVKEIVGIKGSLANPTAILENAEAVNKNHADNTMLGLSFAPKFYATKNFTIQELFSYTMQSFDEHNYTPFIGMPDFDLPEYGRVTHDNNSLYTSHNAVFSDTRFDWAIPLGAHRIDAFGGVRFMNDNFTSSKATAYSIGNDKTPNLSNNNKYPTAVGKEDNWRSMSYYANIDYNYREKYYLQGQLSMETSSRFGKEVNAGLGLFGVRWGLFPSIQGSWVATNESWFPATKAVNFLKVNVGFESVGNDNMDNAATLTYLKSFSMINEKTTGIALANIGNPDLRWETTNRFNFGVEGNFFNNCLGLKFNFYSSKTSNLISLSNLAYIAGVTDYYTNQGALKNVGFDVTAIGKVVNTKDFKMELGASLGHYKNEIKELPVLANGKSSFITSGYGADIISQVGSPVGLFYGYRTMGVYATEAQAKQSKKYVVDETGNRVYFSAGDVIFANCGQDENKDHTVQIGEEDRVVIGDPNPDIYGNIFANFYIGERWSVNMRFNYCLGNDIYNYQRSVLENGSQFMNQTTAVSRRWVTEGQVTDMPKATYNDPMGNGRFSDRWIEDGSYFKFKNITVAYTMPIQSQFIHGMSVSLSANNLFTLTKYLGSDPEVCCSNNALFQGIDAGFLSSGRSFVLGVKLNL